ncbi:Putative elongation of fatty acids protein 1 [Leucoagaricus sp. SymC.cos]|nr:Putative elongation of fatty acids protein 1 [Leucoagaricus sp. SymC.cos]
MAVLADLLLAYIPFRLPPHLTSYVVGQTPLSTTSVVVSALASYLAVIFGTKAFMTNRQPYKLATLFQIHNVFLSSGSALLLALMLEEIVPRMWRHGLNHALCSEEAWTPRMEFYYMVNYYFKYLELLDTVFLALKKKPMQFLHVFHHSATALLCFTQLNGKTSISWSVITLNLAVHVVMYYYYYATAGGRRFWWKKYLTTMQIVQFIIDLFVVYYGTYEHYTYTYWPYLPHLGNCAGSEGAALFGCGLLTSYLGLFINFYFQTYKKPALKKPSGVANGQANGHANGKLNSITYVPRLTSTPILNVGLPCSREKSG